MRNAVLGGFLGTLMAIGVLVACGGSGGGSSQLGASAGQLAFSARALSYFAGSAIITPDPDGLLWANLSSHPASLFMPRPGNYSGGTLTARLVFSTTSNSAGTVVFFIRSRSYEPGDPSILGNGVLGTTTDVTGFPIGTYFRHEMVLPPDELGKSIWNLAIQRAHTSGTHTSDVIVHSIELIYTPA